jgi:hypothetical protein
VSMKYGAWFADEDICRRQEYQRTSMLHHQKLIAKITHKDPTRGAFNAEMLSHDFRVGRAIKGIDPDSGEITPSRVRDWKREHPAITLEEKERMRLRARAVASNLKGNPSGVFASGQPSEHVRDGIGA